MKPKNNNLDKVQHKPPKNWNKYKSVNKEWIESDKAHDKNNNKIKNE